jgi:hypothetical protein
MNSCTFEEHAQNQSNSYEDRRKYNFSKGKIINVVCFSCQISNFSSPTRLQTKECNALVEERHPCTLLGICLYFHLREKAGSNLNVVAM